MADTEQENGNGSNRATVALVDAKVTGIRDLMKAEFGFIKERIKEQIEPLAGVVADVSALKAQNIDQERRLRALEQDKVRGREYWRTHAPQILIALGLLIVAIVTLVTNLH